MAFCKNCGQQMNDDAVFCANCGTPVEGAPQQQATPQQQAPQQAPQQPTYQQAPVTPQVLSPEADVQQNRGIAWLSYVGLLFLIPLFVRKASAYCQYHVKQGVTLFVCDIAYFIAKSIILAIIDAIVPGERYFGYVFHSGVYNVFNVIFNLGAIFFVVLMIIGIVNAASGKMKELPLIGKIPFIANLMDKIYAALNK